MTTVDRKQTLFNPLTQAIDVQPIMRQVYLWMGLGTLLTAVVAYITVNTRLLELAANPTVLWVVILAELGMVLGLSFGFTRISAPVATALFFAYAALNGFTLSIVLLAFSTGTVVSAFAVTASLFAVMSIIGYTTKVDLTKMGTYLLMGLIGLLIAMVVNFFIASGPVDMLISMAGVLIFTALTAYDTQRIGRMAAESNLEGDAAAKLSIFGALRLYLDLINMFLFILRLIGGRRQ